MARKLTLYDPRVRKSEARFHCSLGRRYLRQRREGRSRFSFQWRGSYAECEPFDRDWPDDPLGDWHGRNV